MVVNGACYSTCVDSGYSPEYCMSYCNSTSQGSQNYNTGGGVVNPSAGSSLTKPGNALTEIGFWIQNQLVGKTSLPAQSARVIKDDLVTAAENAVINAKNSMNSLLSKINPAPTSGFYLFGVKIL